MTIACAVPYDCLIQIFEYLWNDDSIAHFYDRRRQHCKEYDQSRIYTHLRTRTTAPLGVCRSWRAAALSRFFHYTPLSLLSTKSKAYNFTNQSYAELPLAALVFTQELFIQISDDDLCTGKAERMLKRSVGNSVSARRLGLCVVGSPIQRQFTTEELEEHRMFGDRMGERFLRLLPRLEQVWFENALDRVSESTSCLINTMQLKNGSQNSIRGVPVTAIQLCTLNNRNNHAVSIVRACAPSLKYLGLGMVSGGILSDIIHKSGNSKTMIYPQLKRITFSVDARANIFSSASNYNACPFPNLEELYYDDTLSNGSPRESWYAALYDAFLNYRNMKLKHLTFPITYNTRRMVSSENCPELIELNHIKCCQTAGIWASEFLESDSTRVLESIATIPTLTSYTHPSYVTHLSNLPAKISCHRLRTLNLYGWPLMLENVIWITQTFPNLHTLKVTVIPTPADNGREIASEDTTQQHGMVGPMNSAFHPSLSAQRTHTKNTLQLESLRSLTIGSIQSGLNDWELPRLYDLLNSIKGLRQVTLYSEAYTYINLVEKTGDIRKPGALTTATILSLDSTTELTSNTFAITSPLTAQMTAMLPPAAADLTSEMNMNYWHIVRDLVIGE